MAVFLLVGCASSFSQTFHVRANKIIGPGGHELIVRGVTVLYGTFAGGDSSTVGAENLQHAPADFARLKLNGINLVRILVSRSVLRGSGFELLHHAVTQARRRGLIVEIEVDEQFPEAVLPILRRLAVTYRGWPYVWLGTSNEPLCRPGFGCSGWLQWQQVERDYIRVVRRNGDHSIIVIDGPQWSWNLSNINEYSLGDSNLVYGAHIYANFTTRFDAAEEAQVTSSWASLASTRPIIVEEVGMYNGRRFPNSTAWVRGFIPYLARWVLDDGGSGAIGFTWHWVDPNTMTSGDFRLNSWGKLFFDQFVRPVSSK